MHLCGRADSGTSSIVAAQQSLPDRIHSILKNILNTNHAQFGRQVKALSFGSDRIESLSSTAG